ncbi:MAG: hypothetical protein A4E32_01982 [Methanomassiliicoccales archaeon PtaU1.Bin124]|nr:MAG: hypothetical protein A4E32_01982 [Methanomassiliicoccales archaeon PtaU1.Bin124]
MAEKKATKAKTKEEKPKAKAAPKKKPVAKPEPVVEEHVHEHEHDEECCCCEEDGDDPIEKNSCRSYLLRDIWFEGLNQVVEEESAPEENKQEMMFLTLSNAILDLVMDIVPLQNAQMIAENLDDFLTVTVVNREYNVDLLQMFKEDFVKEKGDTFEDEIELNNALGEFEESWWNAPRKDLKGKSPNEALDEAAKHYDL